MKKFNKKEWEFITYSNIQKKALCGFISKYASGGDTYYGESTPQKFARRQNVSDNDVVSPEDIITNMSPSVSQNSQFTPVKNNNFSYPNNFIPITPHDQHPAGTTPTGISHEDLKGNSLIPSNIWESGRDVWQNYANNKNIQIPQSGRGPNSDYQEFAYDTLLDTQLGQEQLRNMWKEFGPTLQNRPEFKNYDFENLGEQQLKDLRTNFIDSKLESRFLLPTDYSGSSSKQGPQVGDKANFTTKKVEDSQNQQNNRNGQFGILPIPAISAYHEDPLQTSQLNPHLINYRPTDIEGQIAESNRGFRALTKGLNTSPTGIANTSNAFAQKLRGENEAFGQDFNRRQQGKMAVDEHNAQELSRVDMANLQERNRFMDLVNRGRGVIDTQKRTDAQGALENYYKANQYYNDADFISQHFGPHGNFYYNPTTQSLEPKNPDSTTKYIKTTDSKGNVSYKEETYTKKYGGAIKKNLLKKKKK